VILYVYAIGRAGHPQPERLEAIDGSDLVRSVACGELVAFVTPVDPAEYSQPVIDARSKDVEWLGGIGYRHQSVMSALMRGGTIIPLRAFTLFATEDSLRRHVESEGKRFEKILDRLDGKQEWTLRVEFNPERWSEALIRRVATLRDLAEEMNMATPGRAFLLRKKLDEERKRASREAEEAVVGEIERAVLDKLACDTVAESRQQRSGAFPQINVLINRDEEARLEELRRDLESRHAGDGVSVTLTGPWPPYSFANA
jgi:hypothetical protein